jgi:hypothetical protein
MSMSTVERPKPFEPGEVHDIRWANAEHTGIRCTVTFPNHPQGITEPLDYLAEPGDIEAHGRELFARLDAGEWGEVDEYAPPAAEEILAAVMVQRADLMSAAARQIAPLQYAVDESMATDAEISLLKSWKLYSIVLNRIEQQDGFPASVVWPDRPA